MTHTATGCPGRSPAREKEVTLERGDDRKVAR